jgi:hypothetical protein
MHDDLHGIIRDEMRELTADEIHDVAGGILDNGIGPSSFFRAHIKIIPGYADSTFMVYSRPSRLPAYIPRVMAKWRALRESNPCFRRERAMSWTARRRAQ